MSEFVTIARLGDVPEGEGRVFTVDDQRIAVFRSAGRLYALQNACPHMGESLGLGDLEDDKVVCNRHQWAFRLCDGECEESDQWQAKTYRVRVHGDQIQVSLTDGTST
jgi:nitrite reductase (NADH) small subunit/3-phenylpropionate/trans-cinnamate dioxygenase ferredoxin subunit